MGFTLQNLRQARQSRLRSMGLATCLGLILPSFFAHASTRDGASGKPRGFVITLAQVECLTTLIGGIKDLPNGGPELARALKEILDSTTPVTDPEEDTPPGVKRRSESFTEWVRRELAWRSWDVNQLSSTKTFSGMTINKFNYLQRALSGTDESKPRAGLVEILIKGFKNSIPPGYIVAPSLETFCARPIERLAYYKVTKGFIRCLRVNGITSFDLLRRMTVAELDELQPSPEDRKRIIDDLLAKNNLRLPATR